MSQVSQCVSSEERNTSKNVPRARRWIAVINNWSENDIEKIVSLSQCNYIIGKEVGEQGTKHLQCYLEFPNQMRFNTLKRYLPTAHLEKAKMSAQANLEYCSKDGNYITNMKIPKKLKIISKDSLYPWQLDIENLVHEEPDDRTIHWYWDKKGGAGKTALIKRLVHLYPWITYSTCTKSADIVTQADSMISCYLFNFSRSCKDFDPYGAIEQLKDGLVSNCKLQKKTVNILMNPPHIICFANKPPNIKKLSEDRWKIVRLDEESDDEDDFDA